MGLVGLGGCAYLCCALEVWGGVVFVCFLLGTVLFLLFCVCWCLCLVVMVGGNGGLVGGVFVCLLAFDCIDCEVIVVMVDLVYWLASLGLLWSLLCWVYYSGSLLVLVLM